MNHLQETFRDQGIHGVWRRLKRRHLTEMIIVSIVTIVAGTLLLAIAR